MGFAKYMKALNVVMPVINGVAEAMSPDSEGGEDLTQAELIRLGIRTAILSAKTFNAEIVEEPDTDLVQIIQEELQFAGMM